MKIKITCDSTADLSKELYEKYDIGVMPLIVSLGDNSYYDMVDIVPKDIYDYYEKTGALPKTAARSAYDYKEFFEQYTKQGYQVIHFNISLVAFEFSKSSRLKSHDFISSTYSNFKLLLYSVASATL